MGGLQPSASPSLQAPIRHAAEPPPLGHIGKFLDGFYERAWLLTRAEGDHFKHPLRDKRLAPPQAPGRPAGILDLPIVVENAVLGEADQPGGNEL